MSDDCCKCSDSPTVYETTLSDFPVGGQALPNVTASDSDWSQIATGVSHSLGIKKDGTLWAWGRGLSGELGDGTYSNSDTPVKISDGNWKSVACGERYSLAVTESGDLYSWGANQCGQLGNGSVCDDVFEESVPWAVANISSSVESLVQPQCWGATTGASADLSSALPDIGFRNLEGDAGSGASAVVEKGNLGIKKVTITSGGSGYTSPPSVSFVGGGGVDASAVALVRGGQVVAVVPSTAYGIYFGSRLYDSPPEVVFSGGGGTGASAVAVMEGRPYSVKLTSGGSGYQNPPFVQWIASDGQDLLSKATQYDPNAIGRRPTRLAESPLASVALSGSATPAIRPTPIGRVIGCSIDTSWIGSPPSRNLAGFGQVNISSLGSISRPFSRTGTNHRSEDGLTGSAFLNFEAYANPLHFDLFYNDGISNWPDSDRVPPTITATIIGGGGSGTSYSVGTASATSRSGEWKIPITCTSPGSGHVTDPVLMLEFVGWSYGSTRDFLAIKDTLASADDYRWHYTGMRLTSGNNRMSSQPDGFEQTGGSWWNGTGTPPAYPVVAATGYAPVSGGGGSGARVYVVKWITPATGDVYWEYGTPEGGTGYSSLPDWPSNVALIGTYAVKAVKDVTYIPLVIDGPATSTADLSLPKLYAKPKKIWYGWSYGTVEDYGLEEGGGGLCDIILNDDANWRIRPGYSQAGSVVTRWDNSAEWTATIQGVSISSPGSGYRGRPSLSLVNPCGKPRKIGSGWKSVSATGRTSSGVKSDGASYWWGEGTGFYAPRLNGGEVRVVADVIPGKDVRYLKLSSPDATGLPAIGIVRVCAKNWPSEYAKIDGQYPQGGVLFEDSRTSSVPWFESNVWEPLGLTGGITSLPVVLDGKASASITIDAPTRSSGVRCVSVFNLSGGYTSQPSVSVIRNDVLEKLSAVQNGTYTASNNNYGSMFPYTRYNVSVLNAGSGNVYPQAAFSVIFSPPSSVTKSATCNSRRKLLAIKDGSLFACGGFFEPAEMHNRRSWTGLDYWQYFPSTPQGKSDYGFLFIRQLTLGTISNLTVTYSSPRSQISRDSTTGQRAGSLRQSVAKTLDSGEHTDTRDPISRLSYGDYLRSGVVGESGYGTLKVSGLAHVADGATVTNDGTASVDAFVLSGIPVFGYSAGLVLVAQDYTDVNDGYAVDSQGTLCSLSGEGLNSLVRTSLPLFGRMLGKYCERFSYQSCFITADGQFWNPSTDSIYGEIETQVTNQGDGYTSFPMVSTRSPETTATVSGVVRAIGVYDAGEGYTSEPSVTISGGGGTGAQAVAKIRGRVTGISVADAGGGYSATPLIEFSKPGIPAEAKAIASGHVSQILLRDGGHGYRTRPDVSISGGGGTGAEAVAVFSGGVSSVRIVSGGSGYTSPPQVSFTGGGGSGASATAVLAGDRVDYVAIDSEGQGYTSAPSISFSGGGGAGARATALISGSVTSINITSGGSGYTSAPIVTFSGSADTPAVAMCVLSMSLTSAELVENGLFSKFFGLDPYARSASDQAFISSGYSGLSSVSFGLNASGGCYRSKPTATVVPSRHVESISVTSEGSLYSTPPEVRIWGGGGSGATAVAVLSGSVRRLEFGGTQLKFSSPPTAWLEGGGGSGATVATSYSGTVSGVSVRDGGEFTSQPTVTASGGSAVLAASFAKLQNGKWKIQSVRVISGGTGYQSAPSIVVSGGTATRNAVFSVGMTYSLSSVSLTSGGTGYSSPPTLVVNSQKLPATIVLSASVSRVDVTSEGEGFSSPPVVELIGDGIGANATATISSRDGGASLSVDFSASVLCVDVTSRGSGYTSEPNVAISPPTAQGGRAAAAAARCTFSVTQVPADQQGKNFYGYTVNGLRFASGTGTSALQDVNLWPWTSPPRVGKLFNSGSPVERFFFPEMIYRVCSIGIDSVGAAQFFGIAGAASKQFALLPFSYESTVSISGSPQGFFSSNRKKRYQQTALAGLLVTDPASGAYVGGADSNGTPPFYGSSVAGDFLIQYPSHPYLVVTGTLSSLAIPAYEEVPKYASAPTVEIYNETGTGCTVSSTADLVLSLSNAGADYTNVVVAKVGGGLALRPTPASATCVVSGGSITSVSLSSGGSGYSSPPSIVAQGGGGSGAVLQAKVAYPISDVAFSVTEYANSPSGEDYANAVPVISSEFEIVAADVRWENNGTNTWRLRVASGGLYTQKPKISLSPAIKAFVGDDDVFMGEGTVYAVEIVSGGSGFEQSPSLYFDSGPPEVISPFTSFCRGTMNATSVSHCEMILGTDIYVLLPEYAKATSFAQVFSPGTQETYNPLYAFMDRGMVLDVFELSDHESHKRPSGIWSVSVSPPSVAGTPAHVSVTHPTWSSPSPPSSFPRVSAVRTDV